jgi:hypothetical protein
MTVSIEDMIHQCNLRIRRAEREIAILRELPADTFDHAMSFPPINAPRMLRGFDGVAWLFTDSRDCRHVVVTADGAKSKHRSHRAARREARRRAKELTEGHPTSTCTKSEH